MTVHGVAEEPVEAKHVAGSVMLLTTIEFELRTRKSASPDGAGIDEISTMRNRRRVTGAPVLFTYRRRIESVPSEELFAGSEVKSLTRFGAAVEPFVESSNNAVTVELMTGSVKPSGPGAPRCWPAAVFVPAVSAKKKSCALLFESFGRPVVGHGPKVAGLASLPH